MKSKPDKTPQPNVQAKMLVIDDDPVVTTVFKAHLSSIYENVQIDTVNEPKAIPSYDIYFIDNDFNGEHLACELIEQIREVEPQTLIVALSRTVNLNTLQKLMNLGCNAIYNKRDLQQSADARMVISNYISFLEKQSANGENRNVFSNTVSSLFELLGEWNKRLSFDLSGESKTAR